MDSVCKECYVCVHLLVKMRDSSFRLPNGRRRLSLFRTAATAISLLKWLVSLRDPSGDENIFLARFLQVMDAHTLPYPETLILFCADLTRRLTFHRNSTIDIARSLLNRFCVPTKPLSKQRRVRRKEKKNVTAVSKNVWMYNRLDYNTAGKV